MNNLLEDTIVTAPEILSGECMLIGRQEQTGLGGRFDPLGIAPDGSLVLIEIKRNRTPGEIVAHRESSSAGLDSPINTSVTCASCRSRGVLRIS